MASGILQLLCLSVLVCVSECVYRLRLLDRIFLPYSHNPLLYGYDQNAAVDFGYDAESHEVYVVGQSHIHVISAVTPYFLKHKFHVTLTGYELTDVEVCGGYVIVAADNQQDPEDGRVVIYERYDPVQQTMKFLHSISVGSLPDMIEVTKDCRTIIAAIEGEPYMQGNQLVDPLGGVTLIRFTSTDLSGQYQTKRLDFTGFNAAEYEARGVRFIYKENGNTFARDLEPEYVTLNEDETIAYICIQENNAIATVDISDFNTARITELYPLGYVDWSQSTLDASDRDNSINMRSWSIYGMYQPDTIKFFKLNNQPYLVTMNEGDAKDYASWSEEMRGQNFLLNNMVDDDAVDPIFRDDLAVVTGLGRLKFSTALGKSPGSDKYSSFYAFGSRGFSFRSAADMSLVWDSGNAMETVMSNNMANIFNANANDGSDAVATTFDGRSDDKGPETEAGDVGTIGSDTVFFVGNERTGTIAIYSVKHDLTNPVFHSINYGGNLTTSDSWEYQYNVRRVGDIDPEDIKFISARDSPLLGQDLLVVTGAVSGTLAVYAVIDDDETGTADPTDVLLRNLFDSADANSDEYISKMEFRMFIIGSADLNEDGTVSESEFEYDWEVNKGVTFTEAGFARVFNALDVDNNGVIEPDDCDGFVDIITDKDGNGLLTIDEWRREWRGLLENNTRS